MGLLQVGASPYIAPGIRGIKIFCHKKHKFQHKGPIGNSQGIRIPKAIIEQCHLEGEIELEPKGNCLIIRSKADPRDGWEQALQTMAENEDDKLLYGDIEIETNWDKNEWVW